MAEQVNHPAHYGGDVEHEAWKCLQFHLPKDPLLWNSGKYILRAGKKDPARTIEDLEKAKWYLEKRIELLRAASAVGGDGERGKTRDGEPK